MDFFFFFLLRTETFTALVHVCHKYLSKALFQPSSVLIQKSAMSGLIAESILPRRLLNFFDIFPWCLLVGFCHCMSPWVISIRLQVCSSVPAQLRVSSRGTLVSILSLLPLHLTPQFARDKADTVPLCHHI